jgi:transposase
MRTTHGLYPDDNRIGPNPCMTQEQIQYARYLRREMGASVRQIAAHFAVSPKTIYRYLTPSKYEQEHLEYKIRTTEERLAELRTDLLAMKKLRGVNGSNNPPIPS